MFVYPMEGDPFIIKGGLNDCDAPNNLSKAVITSISNMQYDGDDEVSYYIKLEIPDWHFQPFK